MLSNIELNPGSGGSSLGTDLVDSTHYQIMKLAIGAAGGASLASTGNPLPVAFGDSGSLDAFERLRISNPKTLFESKQLLSDQTLVWNDVEVSGGGTSSTHSVNGASTTLAVTSTTAGVRVRQTRRRFAYQPGKSQLIFITGVVGAGATGITKRLGYFDDNNGLFFELSGTTFRLCIRSKATGSVVDTYYGRDDWNGDTSDGEGASGLTLDLTKIQLFFIDFEWLGAGRVRFGAVANGRMVYFHTVDHANLVAGVYMSTPNLPVRYEISNSGAGAAASLVQICSTVISEGNSDVPSLQLAIDRGATGFATAANTSAYPILALRQTTEGLGSTITPTKLSIICTTTSAFRWALLLNPTVTGTALSFSAVDSASVEACATTSNATTVSGGTTLLSGYSFQTAESGVSIDIPPAANTLIGSAIDGTVDTLVLAVQPLSGAAETFYASLTWNERH